MKFVLCVLLLATSAIFQATAVFLPGPGQASTIDVAKRDSDRALAKRAGSNVAYVSIDGAVLTIYSPTPDTCLSLGNGSTNISNNTDSDIVLFKDGNCGPESQIGTVSSENTLTLENSDIAMAAMVSPK